MFIFLKFAKSFNLLSPVCSSFEIFYSISFFWTDKYATVSHKSYLFSISCCFGTRYQICFYIPCSSLSTLSFIVPFIFYHCTCEKLHHCTTNMHTFSVNPFNVRIKTLHYGSDIHYRFRLFAITFFAIIFLFTKPLGKILVQELPITFFVFFASPNWPVVQTGWRKTLVNERNRVQFIVIYGTSVRK